MAAKLLLLCSGTLGDVRPYLALGQALQAAGYRVTIAGNAPGSDLVKSLDLAYAALDGDPHDLLLRSDYRGALTPTGGWRRSLSASLRYVRDVQPVYEKMWRSAWRAACDIQPAGIVAGLPTTWGYHLAQGLSARGGDVPCIFAPLQPLSRTRSYPSAILPATFSLGPAYNRLTHVVAEWSLWLPLRGALNRWRREQLGLPALSFPGPFAEMADRGVPFVYGFSECVVPRPADWPADHQVAGYWFLQDGGGWQAPDALRNFVHSSPPPVYVGFGSWPDAVVLPLLARLAQAFEQAGLRAVVSASAQAARELAPCASVLPIEYAPHDWLFRRMAAVAHHGGAGTTAAGLRAGVPAVCMPAGVDQCFWAGRIASLGAGPPALPRRSLTAERLAGALRQASGDEGMRRQARRLGECLAAEDGLGRAVAMIRDIVPQRAP